jgi:hypothetical protein
MGWYEIVTYIFSFQVNVSQSLQKTQFDKKITQNYLGVDISNFKADINSFLLSRSLFW